VRIYQSKNLHLSIQIRSAGRVKSIFTFFSGTSAVVQGKHQYDRETQDLTVIATAPTPGIDLRKKSKQENHRSP